MHIPFPDKQVLQSLRACLTNEALYDTLRELRLDAGTDWRDAECFPFLVSILNERHGQERTNAFLNSCEEGADEQFDSDDEDDD